MTTYCYSNNPVLTVNCQQAQLTTASPCSILSSVCDPPVAGGEDPSECGAGLPGDPPPLPLGDVDATHTMLTGSYDKATNKLAVEGCFDGVENLLLGPAVWTELTIKFKDNSEHKT
ncbi:MAG: hypothetical protein IH849_14715, partial [Acidobacteria bacterium]|nr:hypothetical protein [Acidobacteriota bacterium]